MPFALTILPFGLIFGVVAKEAGLDLLETMAMTSLVAAGASQFAVLPMLEQGAPELLAILTGAVVNARMAMYSASLATVWPRSSLGMRMLSAYFLNDQNYALSFRRFRERPDAVAANKLGFYFGVGGLTVSVWVLGTFLGAVIGEQLPPSWSLDFAVPITFIAIVAPILRGLANILAALVGALLSVLLIGLPFGTGFLIAAVCGIFTGYAVETWLQPWLQPWLERRAPDKASGV
ncbi:MAG: AzlC family ABC transporter permease [Neomegalonema sp.]|nr:AzlC family ABC transporter permease [Neomegalonema sp.]